MADSSASPRARKRAHGVAILWSLLFIAVAAMVLPLGGYVYTAYAQDGGSAASAQWGDQSSNPRSDTWRDARQGGVGYSAVQGQEANVLIANGGQNWRQLRNGPVANIMPWFMLAAVVGIVLVLLISGRHRIHEPRSGMVVPRWKLWERVLHWTTATLFIVLAITGLSLFFGRAVLIPVLGPEGFAAWAVVAMNLHNYIGPVFSVCVALMILAWIWFNFPNRTDLQWFRNGGGFIKGRHVSAGRANGGEKIWFWFILLVGGAVCVSGLILDFPNFGQTRETMQLANLIHGVTSILWIAMFLGHAYIGTIGTEGALEGMTTGYVSSEWARQHHDEWYEQVRDREQPEEAVRGKGAGQQQDSSTSG